MAEMNENFSNSRVSETISKTVLSNMKETYDMEGMSGHIGNFNNLLQTYENETKKIDDAVTETICADGFKGDYANKLLSTYDSLVGNFAGFTQNYQEWNDAVAVEDAMYGSFTEEAIGDYKGTGGEGKKGSPYKNASTNRSADGKKMNTTPAVK